MLRNSILYSSQTWRANLSLPCVFMMLMHRTVVCCINCVCVSVCGCAEVCVCEWVWVPVCECVQGERWGSASYLNLNNAFYVMNELLTQRTDRQLITAEQVKRKRPISHLTGRQTEAGGALSASYWAALVHPQLCIHSELSSAELSCLSRDWTHDLEVWSINGKFFFFAMLLGSTCFIDFQTHGVVGWLVQERCFQTEHLNNTRYKKCTVSRSICGVVVWYHCAYNSQKPYCRIVITIAYNSQSHSVEQL